MGEFDPIRTKMHTGEIYDGGDTDLMHEQLNYLEEVRLFNNTPCSLEGLRQREEMMKEMFAEVGENCYIEPPIHSNFGLKHVHFGKDIYVNFNLTIVDDTYVYVGDNTMIAPNVVIATAGHPIEPRIREAGGQYNMQVHIGKNCWIGAGALILPGVTIGDNSVIGAGSVVTKDIPENVVAYGNPCKVVRPINEHDEEYYFKDRKIPEYMKRKYFK